MVLGHCPLIRNLLLILLVIVILYIISAGYVKVTLFEVVEMAKHGQETIDLISPIRWLHHIPNSSSYII